MRFSMQAVGDVALKVNFSGEVSAKLNTDIQLFCQKLEVYKPTGVVEWVPAYDSVTIYYLAHKITYSELVEKTTALMDLSINTMDRASRLLYVPVLYGGRCGPDLKRVADYNHCSAEEVIKLHQEPDYLVYMLGFLPGFPYLGGLNQAIATPRLEKPRATTFAGAVGIAQEQTGIYPLASPGGWNIIGKIPLQLFQKERTDDAFLFCAGDRVRFYQITEQEYIEIEEQVLAGTFSVEM